MHFIKYTQTQNKYKKNFTIKLYFYRVFTYLEPEIFVFVIGMLFSTCYDL